MIPMDESTQLNHWIALMAELEETCEKIAKAVYKHYKAGRIADDYCLECCRRMDELYNDAKEYENYLKEDFKTLTETKEGQASNVGAKAQAKAVSFLSGLYIKHNVAVYKRHFRDQYLELGARVIAAAEDGRVVCNVPQVVEWIRYATKVKKEADMRWEEITILHREQVKGNAFMATLKQFFASFSNFARTKGGPMVQKLFGQNEQLVNQLRTQYRQRMGGEGSPPPR